MADEERDRTGVGAGRITESGKPASSNDTVTSDQLGETGDSGLDPEMAGVSSTRTGSTGGPGSAAPETPGGEGFETAYTWDTPDAEPEEEADLESAWLDGDTFGSPPCMEGELEDQEADPPSPS